MERPERPSTTDRRRTLDRPHHSVPDFFLVGRDVIREDLPRPTAPVPRNEPLRALLFRGLARKMLLKKRIASSGTLLCPVRPHPRRRAFRVRHIHGAPSSPHRSKRRDNPGACSDQSPQALILIPNSKPGTSTATDSGSNDVVVINDETEETREKSDSRRESLPEEMDSVEEEDSPSDEIPVDNNNGQTDEWNINERMLLYVLRVLECPVCFEHITPPMLQCTQGHLVCETCRDLIDSCPECRSPFSNTRNRAMEKIADIVSYPCTNACYGCTTKVNWGLKKVHELQCEFRMFTCLDKVCRWKGFKSELINHMSSFHPKSVITDPTNQSVEVPLVSNRECSWLMFQYDEVFLIFFKIDELLNYLFVKVTLLGSPGKEAEFRYEFQLKSDIHPFATLTYSQMPLEESRHTSGINRAFKLHIKDFLLSHARLLPTSIRVKVTVCKPVM